MYKYGVCKEIEEVAFNWQEILKKVREIATKHDIKAFSIWEENISWIEGDKDIICKGFAMEWGQKEQYINIDSFCIDLNKALPGAKATWHVIKDVEFGGNKAGTYRLPEWIKNKSYGVL